MQVSVKRAIGSSARKPAYRDFGAPEYSTIDRYPLTCWRQFTRLIAGGFQFPFATCGLGAYRRNVRPRRPLFGAGSQFSSLSEPGLSFWIYRSSDPSPLKLSGSRSPMAKRLIVLATWKPSASYMVSDQNASTGGSSSFLKCRIYLFSAMTGLPSL